MSAASTENLPLSGRRIAIPESRELDLFATMLEERGARAVRCPLVSILDAPDPVPVEAWLRDFSTGNWDDLILLTGEGLRRLLGFAERAGGGLRDDFIAALERVRKITRGPKPANALRQIGLKADLPALAPTTEGVIETLDGETLAGRHIGVQLYGDNPNLKLVNYLASREASVHTVAPYIYADDADNHRVEELLRAIQGDQVDAIAFTSSPQVRRLFKVAGKEGAEPLLRQALNRITVAAVGPVVAKDLEAQGVHVDLMPDGTYFMKPLVRELVRALGK